MVVVYPGSFDPLTYGHLDVITRCAKQFDKVVIGILVNQSKKALFTVEERVEMIEVVTKDIPNVEVKTFDGLLVNFCEENNSKTIIKGLRAISDYEYELQMATVNNLLSDNEVETFFMQARGEYEFLSSSIVKEIASYGGNLKGFVPESIEKRLVDKFKGGK